MYSSYYGLTFNPFDKQQLKEKDHFISRDFTEMIGRLDYLKDILNILASGNRISGAVETYIPDTETAFDWLNYHP